MKLDNMLIRQLVLAGDARKACDVLLARYGCGPLPLDAKIRINSIEVMKNDHILVYMTGHWYEWGSNTGFRDGQFSNYRDETRAVIWRYQRTEA